MLSLHVAAPANATGAQGKPGTAADNAPSAKPATSTTGKPDEKQPAVEKPMDAKAKPAIITDTSSPEKLAAPVKEEPGAQQPPTREPLPTEEKLAEPKARPLATPGPASRRSPKEMRNCAKATAF